MLFPQVSGKLIRRSAIVALSALVSFAASADRDAVGDDGRKITLKDDGSWEYSDTDRYATSVDGTRVRLKDNGSWEFIGNAPVKSEKQFREESLDINLSQVVMEYSKKKVPGSKNSRIAANTIFFLDVDISSYSDKPITASLADFSGITVTDNRKNTYEVISVTPTNQKLEPGSKYGYEIRVEGAPKFSLGFLNIKTITLNIDKSVFLSNTDIVLSRDADEILERKVSKL